MDGEAFTVGLAGNGDGLEGVVFVEERLAWRWSVANDWLDTWYWWFWEDDNSWCFWVADGGCKGDGGIREKCESCGGSEEGGLGCGSSALLMAAAEVGRGRTSFVWKTTYLLWMRICLVLMRLWMLLSL